MAGCIVFLSQTYSSLTFGGPVIESVHYTEVESFFAAPEWYVQYPFVSKSKGQFVLLCLTSIRITQT